MTLGKMPIMNEKIDTDRHQHLMFKGPDGKDYATLEGLTQSTEAHKRATLFKIAHGCS